MLKTNNFVTSFVSKRGKTPGMGCHSALCAEPFLFSDPCYIWSVLRSSTKDQLVRCHNDLADPPFNLVLPAYGMNVCFFLANHPFNEMAHKYSESPWWLHCSACTCFCYHKLHTWLVETFSLPLVSFSQEKSKTLTASLSGKGNHIYFCLILLTLDTCLNFFFFLASD